MFFASSAGLTVISRDESAGDHGDNHGESAEEQKRRDDAPSSTRVGRMLDRMRRQST